MWLIAGFCHAFVQSPSRLCFVHFLDDVMLELDHFIRYAFQRTPPTHEMTARPIIMFALRFQSEEYR